MRSVNLLGTESSWMPRERGTETNWMPILVADDACSLEVEVRFVIHLGTESSRMSLLVTDGARGLQVAEVAWRCGGVGFDLS